MMNVIDQTGRKVEVSAKPAKIISLVPSQTELLFDLGLDKEVVGITKFCVHPHFWFEKKTKVGGTKRLKLAKIKELNPDLIIANKEENSKEQIEELSRHFPVWVSNVKTLEDAYAMIKSIGLLTNKSQAAAEMIQKIKTEFKKIKPSSFLQQTAYLIWQNPLMTIGGDTFINSMLVAAGFKNLFESELRYPKISMDELQNNCQILLLPSEPYPFSEKHAEEFRKELPETKVVLVDGQFFSWYGSRLSKAPGYFRALLKIVK